LDHLLSSVEAIIKKEAGSRQSVFLLTPSHNLEGRRNVFKPEPLDCQNRGSAAAHGGKPPAYRTTNEEKKEATPLARISHCIGSYYEIDAQNLARSTLLLFDVSRQGSIAGISQRDDQLITGAALDEARRSGNFALYAYVIMSDHLHVITDSLEIFCRMNRCLWI